MASAPVGYSNKVNEENRKCIVINPTVGPIIFWVFNEIATGRFNTEQVWKMAKERGLKCSKNAFWLAIRNPVYCGKIFIPPYKDEPGYFVKGQHQGLISEQLFSEVQDVIDGRKKNPFNKPKVVSHDSFPLRGFLECHKCGRVLTGSASKGKYNYYNYYHCTAQCGVRFKAESTNEEFLQEMQKYVLRPGRLELYTMAIQQDFKNQMKAQDHERKTSVIELENINKRLQNARMMKVDGSLADDDFLDIKTTSNKRIEEIEKNLGNLSDKYSEISTLLPKALERVSKLESLYRNGTTEDKRQIISSMFPEKIVFDGKKHRTPKVNSGLLLIYQKQSELEQIKNGTNRKKNDLSRMVHLIGQISNFFISHFGG